MLPPHSSHQGAKLFDPVGWETVVFELAASMRQLTSGEVGPKAPKSDLAALVSLPGPTKGFWTDKLKAAIREFIDAHQANPKPFVWTKTADQILASIARFAQRTFDVQAAQLVSRTTVTGH